MTPTAVCAFDDLASGTARKFDVDGMAIAVVRIGDDVYAIGDVCSHANVSLSEGEVFTDEREIECPQHGSTFSLTTGEACTLPATQPVPVFDDDTSDTLAARVFEVEKEAYPHVLRLLASGRIKLEGRRVRIAASKRRDSSPEE